MGGILDNSVLANNIWVKDQNSKENSNLQLKQYIETNFGCYLNVSSTTHEIHYL